MNSLSNGLKHVLNASWGDLMALIIVPGEMERNASNRNNENKQARSPTAPTPRSSAPRKARASKNKPKQRHGNAPLTGSPAELPKFTPHTPTPSTVIV